MKNFGSLRLPKTSSKNMYVVTAAPISTTSMTGLPSRCRGLSFLNESIVAWRMIGQFQIAVRDWRGCAISERCSRSAAVWRFCLVVIVISCLL